MIARFGTPSICVIDDDPNEYKPILEALSQSWVGWIHVLGNDKGKLPQKPLSGLRLVFTDLYLTNDTPKNAISRTARVFKSVVATDTAPVVVVIWSKHSADKDLIAGLPPEDQPTQADQFKKELLEGEKKYSGRLVFIEMAKPSGLKGQAKRKWIRNLHKEIENLLKDFHGIDTLWGWESFVRNVTCMMSGDLATLAQDTQEPEAVPKKLDAKLKLIFRALTAGQGGKDFTKKSAARHLVTVLGQALADRIEHQSENASSLEKHGEWLGKDEPLTKNPDFAARINGILLTAKVNGGERFPPGMVYFVTDQKKSEKLLGTTWEKFIRKSVSKLNPEDPLPDWTEDINKVFIEISQPCDAQNNNRNKSIMLGGIVIPAEHEKKISGNFARDANGADFRLPAKFRVNWHGDAATEKDVFLFACAHLKCMLSPTRQPKWLQPWFRLREMPAATIRGWHSGHMARVGFVSL